MQYSPSIPIQQLKTLFSLTYLGSSTDSIQNAFSKLIQISLNNSNHFLGLCQTILETQHKNRGLCLSIANFVKVLTKKAIDQKLIDPCGPKNFINRIEHIFDNSKIPAFLKENIAVSFIKAALHFRMNFQKVIEKILYLYNVKDSQQAIFLSRGFISCDNFLDPKIQGLYYKKILPAEFKYLSQEISAYKNLVISQNSFNETDKIQESLGKIEGVLRNIHSSLINIPFQKFESSIFTCLQKDEIIEVIYSMDRLRKNKGIMILFRELIQKIVENLFRMRRIQKMPNLMKAISQMIHQQWRFYQNVVQRGKSCFSSECRNIENEMEPQQQLSVISLLTVGFSSHIIMMIDDNIDIWNLLIIPLYEMKVCILNKNRQNVKQTFLILQDSTFIMKSQCIEVAFNKFVKSILDNYHSISSKITIQIDALLHTHLHNQLNQNDQNKMLMLMNFITFQASHFLTQDSFISSVQNFLKTNTQQLFVNQNSQVYFQSLFLLYHFIDDVFCQYLDNDIFEIIAQNFIQHTKDKISLQNSVDSALYLIIETQKLILTSFFSAGFSEKQTQKPSQNIINFSCQFFDNDCLKVFTCLIKNYPIEDRITLQVLDKVIEKINELVIEQKINLKNIHEEITAFIQFLVTFFDLDIYKHLFQSTLVRILPFFQHMIGNKNQFQEDFFIIIKNFTTHLEYVPQNYLEWMGNIFNHRIMQTQQSFKSLSILLKYLSPSKYNTNNLKYELFVNCIALNLIEILVTCNQSQKNSKERNSLTYQLTNHRNQSQFFFSSTNKRYQKREISGLLCLHQLIHYHSQYLTKKILNHIVSFTLTKILFQNQNHQQRDQKSDFSLEKGKYKLILILLFKRRLFDTNQILVEKGMQRKVYDAVYMKENHYLLEYDTPLFIKQQVQILRKLIKHDQFQMAYANTSFLAIFHKFSILFQTKKNHKGKCTLFDIESDDSDDQELETQSQLKRQYKQMTRFVLNFPLPKQWNQIDELKEMKQFIEQLRSNPVSRQWLEILYEKCLNNDQKKVMEELMKNLQTVNGKYRHIVRVNKSSVPIESTSRQKNIFEI